MSEHIKVVEINGVKMEIDLRTAKVVENYKVGNAVKVLVKEYGDKYKSLPGSIIGFDNFKELPTIVVMYIDETYSDAGIKLAYINDASKDIELCLASEDDLHYDKTRILNLLDRTITEKERELDDAKMKRSHFEDMLGKHFLSFIPTGA